MQLNIMIYPQIYYREEARDHGEMHLIIKPVSKNVPISLDTQAKKQIEHQGVQVELFHGLG